MVSSGNVSRRARGPQKFKQTELVRALKAAAAAGVNVQRYEIAADGRIVVVAVGADPVPRPIRTRGIPDAEIARKATS